MQLDPITSRAMHASARRPSRRSPWLQLLAALLELAEGRAELIRHGERTWASATFAGTRHNVVLAFTGVAAIEAAERFIAALPEHEFAIARQLVADAAIIGVEHTALPQPRMLVDLQMLLLDED